MTRIKLRAAVIGLDGATFDVIQPLIAEGYLPNIGRLLQEGSSGTLESIIPPLTGPAWSVLATGKNPGKLGIFDFINRKSLDDYQLYPIRSQDLAGQTFWDILSANGYRVGVFNYPMLVPAYPIDGWMVAGLGASKLHQFTYPAELKQEIERETGGYEINISYGLPKYLNNWSLLVEDMKISLRKRIKALEYLLSKDPVDVLVSVFIVSDVASHTLWQFWQAGKDASDPFVKQMRAEYIAIWQELDEIVGKVLEHLAEDGHVLVVSDHGFGSSHDVFHINYWLQQQGYLVQKSTSASNGNRLRSWLVSKGKPFLNPIFRLLEGSKAHQVLRASLMREIDLEQTKAFALENSDGHGGIFINREYARLRGMDVETFVSEISTKLKSELNEWGSTQSIKLDVHLSGEIYFGKKAFLAPEVILLVNDGECSVSYHIKPPVYLDQPHHPMKSGTHRLNGIFIAKGPKVRQTQVKQAQLQDVAPTFLHLLDLAVDPSMDGRVLKEMLKPEFDQEREAQAQQSAYPVELKDFSNTYEEDPKAFLERLKDLGYLD